MNFGLVVCVALCQDYSGKNVCFCCLAGMKMLVGHLELSEQIQIWTFNLGLFRFLPRLFSIFKLYISCLLFTLKS